LILATLTEAATAIKFEDLGLEPILFEYGFLKIRWYSLAYIAAIIGGWWYLLKMVANRARPLRGGMWMISCFTPLWALFWVAARLYPVLPSVHAEYAHRNVQIVGRAACLSMAG
jgi:prolipoprotein diacylglyceryltransferase